MRIYRLRPKLGVLRRPGADKCWAELAYGLLTFLFRIPYCSPQSCQDLYYFFSKSIPVSAPKPAILRAHWRDQGAGKCLHDGKSDTTTTVHRTRRKFPREQRISESNHVSETGPIDIKSPHLAGFDDLVGLLMLSCSCCLRARCASIPRSNVKQIIGLAKVLWKMPAYTTSA